MQINAIRHVFRSRVVDRPIRFSVKASISKLWRGWRGWLVRALDTTNRVRKHGISLLSPNPTDRTTIQNRVTSTQDGLAPR